MKYKSSQSEVGTLILQSSPRMAAKIGSRYISRGVEFWQNPNPKGVPVSHEKKSV